jgi:hypothetical protein
MKNQKELFYGYQFKKTELSDVSLTDTFSELLVYNDSDEVNRNRPYISYNDLDKIMVEAGGSPFDNCFHYEKYYPRDGWYCEKSELMHYMDIENEDDFYWENGWEYVNGDGFFNWKNVGSRLQKLAENQFPISFKKDYYENQYIPMEWVLLQLDIITGNDYYILFTTEDWYNTICNENFRYR